MHLPSNTILQSGKYRIRRFISSGGFGCTYEAEHILLEKRVAIKEFFVKDFCNRNETTAHVTVGTISKQGLVEKLRSKFIEEAKALSKLHHPGIVSVSDVFEENGTAYFVMDYIEGRSLSEILREQGPLPEERAVRYISQVADALQYVHDNNRLHLDLKPGNIMVDHNDRPILIDFGASKQYDELDGENTSTLLGNTPGYAPPEQMSRSVVKFLPATDIYSLGATLYKLVTNITPPDASLRISGEDLVTMPDKISVAVQNAVTAAMEINKAKRPQTLSAFVKLLETNPEIADETTLVVGKGVTDVPNIGLKTPVVGPAEERSSRSKPAVNESSDKRTISSKKIITSVIGIAVALFLSIFYFSTRPHRVNNQPIMAFSPDLVESISFGNNTLSLNVGESAPLFVNYKYLNDKSVHPFSSYEQQTIIGWHSDAPAIATVDSSGKVTAISTGKATILASYEGKKCSCVVSVTSSSQQSSQSNTPTEIYMPPTRSINATVGEAFNLDYKITPTFAKNKIVWSSSNTTVATISSSGIITAKGNGKTNIVAKVDDVSAKCVLEISIKEMSLSQSSLQLKLGQTHTLYAYNYGNSLSWESGNTKVATVSTTGKVTAVGHGETYIWAKGSYGRESCKVTVTGNITSSSSNSSKNMSLSKSELTLNVGQTYTLTAYDYGSSLSWSSDNTRVATVSATGKVTAVAPGRTYIWAEGSDKLKGCFVIVTGGGASTTTPSNTPRTGYPGDIYIKRGETIQLKVLGQTVSRWESDNTKVATVSSTGLVQGNSIGETNIWGYVDGSPKRFHIYVK